MAQYQFTVATTCRVGLAVLGIIPAPVAAQGPRAGQPPPAAVVRLDTWSAPPQTRLPTVSGSAYHSGGNHSGARIIATHTVVGAGAGLLIGLVLSGASAGDDRTSVVLTWTALGGAAGVVSGVIAWLVGRQG